MTDVVAAVRDVIPANSFTIKETDHGFKTRRVIATRYKNDRMGQYIGFRFPMNWNECDRAELSDFMDAHDGWPFQIGGYPSAEMFVKFDSVTDVESANKKIKDILPPLSQLIEDLGNGVPVKIERKAPKYEWPDTDPPDKTDPYWEFNNNLNVNGTPYKKAEIAPGHWKWIIDQDSVNALMKYNKSKDDLAFALTSRVLTDDEMDNVKALGISLFTRNMVAYSEEDVQRQLNEALLQQYRIRAAAGIK